jgi:hypothetical protein
MAKTAETAKAMAAIVVAVKAEATEAAMKEEKTTINFFFKYFFPDKLKPLLLNRQNQLLHIFVWDLFIFIIKKKNKLSIYIISVGFLHGNSKRCYLFFDILYIPSLLD